MEDNEIVQLFQLRSESAITETANKYGNYCHKIAFGILYDNGESEECVNESYFKLWEAIPPAIPRIFSVFIGKIVRNTAFDIYKRKKSLKRGGGETALVLSELIECVGPNNTEEEIDRREAVRLINKFLEKQDEHKRKIFVLRYWYLMPVKKIASKLSMKESNVKVILFRLREQLRFELSDAGIMHDSEF